MRTLRALSVRWRVILLTVVSLSCSSSPRAAHAPTQPELRLALLKRAVVDQAVRDTLVEMLRSGRQPDSAFVKRMEAVDVDNTNWLKQTVARVGWPGSAMVDVDGADAAFLLIQHADHDTAFQQYVLPLLERGVSEKQVSGEHFALLFDRVNVAKHRPQRFGTQASIVNGRMAFDPIEDSAHVDERRHAVGLPPISQYARMLDSIYIGSAHK